MRDEDRRSGSLFSYVDIETRVRSDHPLRTIKSLADEALASLSGRFAALYWLPDDGSASRYWCRL